MVECLGSSPCLAFGRIDLHRLVELVLDDFSRRRLDTIESYRWLLGGSLRLESLALNRDILLSARGEGLPHVLVPLILLIDQVIGGRYVVVSVRFEASD